MVYRQADRLNRRGSSGRVRLLACAVAVSVSVLGVSAPVLAAPKPPNPTNAQLAQAAAAKAALAQTVGVLSAELVSAQSQLRSLSSQAELAEQKFAYAMSLLQQAKAQSVAAQAAVVSAQKSITAARSNLTNYVRDSYMSPTVGSTTVGLLTATDPSALLQSGDYQNYISAHHLDAMSALDRATIAKSNADATAKSLVVKQQQLTAAAARAQQAAQAAYQREQVQAAQLRVQQASYQSQLNAARAQLATLNGQRRAYNAYVAEQARIAAERARQAELARERAAAAAAAALAAQQAQQSQNNGGGGGGGSVAPPAPSGPSGGSWNQGMGQAAAAKALSQLGVRYAWDGGGYGGATFGVNSPGTDGWNDSTVFGFDCSGLTMFAWYPAISMPHYAASQYYSGNFHPQPGQFMPGDLLFWSDGGVDAIHHVAMYVGGGNVVQAPNSGDVVRVTPWDQVSYGYLGATRPLS